MQQDNEFKTGYSAVIKISTMNKIKEFSEKLHISKGDVGRKIFEYFFEHNDIEDIIQA